MKITHNIDDFLIQLFPQYKYQTMIWRFYVRTKYKRGVDKGKNPPGSFWGEVREIELHKSLEEKRMAGENIKS